MKITQIRNATQIITYAAKRFLVDPMLAPKGAWPGFPGTAHAEIRNPMVDLPFGVDKIVDVDAVIVTHTHEDHWDQAALDCCLYIIRQRFGSVVANQIARRMIVPPHREGGQAQFIAQPVPENTRDTRINCLIDYLQRHIHERHNLDSLAEVVSMSRRTLTRHFVKATGMTVADWLTAERLRRSQILLESGSLPIETVAEQVGFVSPVTYRQQFKSRFGVSPAEWRKTFRNA